MENKNCIIYEMQIFESILQMNGALNDLPQPIYIFSGIDWIRFIILLRM